MPSISSAPSSSRPKRTMRKRGSEAITEDLVQKVTERVYRMLLDDLMLELERRRPSSLGFHGTERW